MVDDEWVKVRRIAGPARFSPVITIRKNGVIAISSDFVRMANITPCTRASVFLSKDGLRLALHFHADESDDDAFILARDGGTSPKSPSRVINARALLSQSSTVSAMCRENDAIRRCVPVKIGSDRWSINLAPCFEREFASPSDVGTSSGIYRYKLGDEIVYVGRGNLRERFAAPDRRSWTFDRIEFSILNDDVAERKWEAFWIDDFKSRTGRLPVYNRIGGSSGDGVG